MNSEEAKAFLLAEFKGTHPPEPGPLRWLDICVDTVILQQQWSVPGRTIWVDVPIDVPSAATSDDPRPFPETDEAYRQRIKRMPSLVGTLTVLELKLLDVVAGSALDAFGEYIGLKRLGAA
jgi:hypothetical protein